MSEKIDTSSAAGKMIFRMLAVLAEFERDVIAERTKTALHHKRKKGERVGGVPIGYRADGARLVESRTEQQTIGLVRDLRAEGRSVRAIARELNARGVPARGKAWHATSVARLLKRAA